MPCWVCRTLSVSQQASYQVHYVVHVTSTDCVSLWIWQYGFNSPDSDPPLFDVWEVTKEHFHHYQRGMRTKSREFFSSQPSLLSRILFISGQCRESSQESKMIWVKGLLKLGHGQWRIYPYPCHDMMFPQFWRSCPLAHLYALRTVTQLLYVHRWSLAYRQGYMWSNILI